jgi:hypothetical protein
MPRVEFELTIPVFERTKTFRASDRSATVIGSIFLIFSSHVRLCLPNIQRDISKICLAGNMNRPICEGVQRNWAWPFHSATPIFSDGLRSPQRNPGQYRRSEVGSNIVLQLSSVRAQHTMSHPFGSALSTDAKKLCPWAAFIAFSSFPLSKSTTRYKITVHTITVSVYHEQVLKSDCNKITTWINGLCTLSFARYSKEHYRTQRFGNWISFHPQGWEWETPTLLGPLARANVNHWTTFVNITTAIYIYNWYQALSMGDNRKLYH